jgi:hypothetical protein
LAAARPTVHHANADFSGEAFARVNEMTDGSRTQGANNQRLPGERKF